MFRQAIGKGDIEQVLAQLESRSVDVDRDIVEQYLAVLGDLTDRVQRTVRLLEIHHPVNGEYVAKAMPHSPPLLDDAFTGAPFMKTPELNVSKVDDVAEDADPDQWGEIGDLPVPSSVVVHNALLKDVEKIVEVFPHVDRQEVYAYLESHVDREDRVEVVIEELVNGKVHGIDCPTFFAAEVPKRKIVEPAKDFRVRKKTCVESKHFHKAKLGTNHAGPVALDAAVVAASSSAVDDASSNGPSTSMGEPSDFLTSQCSLLKDMFPDADPDFLFNFLLDCNSDEDRLKRGVENLLETRNYPSLKAKLEREKKEQMEKVYTTRQFKPEEILQWDIDPLIVFYDTTKAVGRRYRELTIGHLRNMFPHIRASYFRKILCQENFHFLPCLRSMERLDWQGKGPFYKQQRTSPVKIHTEPDELFYKEFAFSRVEQEFRDYVHMKKRIRVTKVEEGRANGTLLSCNCCFEDELIAEDTVECPNQHTFCHDCVRKGMEVAIGQGKTALECMTAYCHTEFALAILHSVLNPNMFSNLLKKIQSAEIEQAGIQDLEMCPFCSFAAIMPNHEDKVFSCLNPHCLKETCRLCKEPNHVPLKCSEVERPSEVKMRTYIENKMSEALMRECPRCKRRFTKSEGCNLMTCICGTKICYVCRKPVENYGHFGRGRCPQESDMERLHVDDITRSATEAKRRFVEENPDMNGLELKFDPTKTIDPVPTSNATLPNNVVHDLDRFPPGFPWIGGIGHVPNFFEIHEPPPLVIPPRVGNPHLPVPFHRPYDSTVITRATLPPKNVVTQTQARQN